MEHREKGVSECVMLQLTRFHVHDFYETSSCSFVSSVLPPVTSEWWKNLEVLFSEMLSLSCQVTFIPQPNPESERGKDSLGDEVRKQICVEFVHFLKIQNCSLCHLPHVAVWKHWPLSSNLRAT